MDLAGLIPWLRARIDPSAEDGFGIIEVLVSAVMVVLISTAMFTAIDAAGRTADRNKSRSVASSLAQEDQERLRSIAITALAKSNTTREATVDGETYTINSKGEYLPGSAGSSNCASNDEAPKYVKITSTVTWENMGTAKPVVANSLRATPSGTIGDFGSLAVDINGRTGAGQADIEVTITPDAAAAAAGGVTTKATTNSQGCVIFGYIRSGRYTITFSKPGYVLAANPNLPSVNESAVVAADSIASKSYTYDLAGEVRASYLTNASFGSTAWTKADISGTEFTIANALLGANSNKTFSHPAASTSPYFGGNFPFTTDYEAWSGGCDENRPPGTGQASTVNITPGGSLTVNVREYRLRLNVQRRTSTSGGNYATMPNDGRTTVRLYPVTSGCTSAFTAATWVQNVGSAGTTASSHYSVYEAIVPWGTYKVCVAYNNTSTNRARNYNVTNAAPGATTPNGTTYGTRIEVPYNQSSNYSCPNA